MLSECYASFLLGLEGYIREFSIFGWHKLLSYRPGGKRPEMSLTRLKLGISKTARGLRG